MCDLSIAHRQQWSTKIQRHPCRTFAGLVINLRVDQPCAGARGTQFLSVFQKVTSAASEK